MTHIESPLNPNPQRTESYWEERNRLVDAVRAIDVGSSTSVPPTSVYMAPRYDEPGAADIRAAYRAALEALKAFDEAHGGAPIL